ncbi:MAG: GNAT family N-acetyltransferase [Bacteroidales bacterium]|nr:GNAT family N-acetyltransferase [Bacteroidales bacterium]
MELRITTDPSAVQRSDWEAWVLQNPEATVFHSPGMYEAYLDTSNWEPVLLLALSEASRLTGVLLAVLQREPGLITGQLSSRSVIFGGPVADDFVTIRALLQKYGEVIRGRAIYTQVRNFTVPGEELKRIYSESGFVFEEHLNIRINLRVTEAEFWKGIKQNRKAGINKAKKQGFTFRVTADEELITPFYRLLGSTYERTRLPYPDISYFRSLSRNLQGELRWFILEKDAKPGIILAAFVSKQTLYIFYPGIDQSPSWLQLRPVDLFYYEVIRWGMENGVAVLDWMGAGKPGKEYGVRYFKQQYGGELINPGRFQAVHRPLLMLIGKTGVSLLKLTGKKQ